MVNTLPQAIQTASYTYGRHIQAVAFSPITAIPVLRAALRGPRTVSISPRAETLVIALYRSGQLLPEIVCLPTTSNTEFLALHGLLMANVLFLAALMAVCKPGMPSPEVISLATRIIPARSTRQRGLPTAHISPRADKI